MLIRKEFDWLYDNESIFFNEDKNYYQYDLLYIKGKHRFIIDPSIERRMLSRDLLNEYKTSHNVTKETETEDYNGPVTFVLPTGTISMSQVNDELNEPSTTTISLNDADVRKIAEKPSGTISMSDLRGKSWDLYLTVTSNTSNYVLRNYLAETYHTVHLTINPNVWVYSTSTGIPALDGTGLAGKANNVVLNCNGYVQGRGGNGGKGGGENEGGAGGGAGGIGLKRGSDINWTKHNAGNIRGGGGGGGGGGCNYVVMTKFAEYQGGGGGGGGIGLGGLGGGGYSSYSGWSGKNGGQGSLTAAGSGGSGGSGEGQSGGRGGNGGGPSSRGNNGGNAHRGGGAGGNGGAAESVVSGSFSDGPDGISGQSEIVKPDKNTLVVKSLIGHDITYTVPEGLEEYAHLIVPAEFANYLTKDSKELETWSELLNIKTSVSIVNEEHFNIDEYDKVEILGDVFRVHKGDYMELIHIPDNKEHLEMIMNGELLALANDYIERVGL